MLLLQIEVIAALEVAVVDGFHDVVLTDLDYLFLGVKKSKMLQKRLYCYNHFKNSEKDGRSAMMRFFEKNKIYLVYIKYIIYLCDKIRKKIWKL